MIPAFLRNFLITVILVFGQIGLICAQESDTLFRDNGFTHPNGIYLELLGPGAIYSVGYERMLLNQSQFKTSIQTGLAWYPESAGAMRMTLPLTINEILSFERHHIKIGAGTTLILKHFSDIDVSNSLAFLAHLRLAYRYQKTDGRYFWEISVIPFLEGDSRAFQLQSFKSMTTHLWAGLTIGKAF